jgi:hypothetical protein
MVAALRGFFDESAISPQDGPFMIMASFSLCGQPTVDAFDNAFRNGIRYMTFFLAQLDANHTGFILN